MGAIIFPKISPSLIQLFLTGVRIFEFIIPKTKNIREIIKDQLSNSDSFKNYYNNYDD